MCGKRLIGAVTIAMLLSSVAVAQPQGGRGGFGRGGFGGFGGFGGGGLGGLIRMDKVQEELELLDDQKSEITKMLEAQRGQRGERPNFRDLSDEERQKAFAEMREQAEKREKETREKLNGILLPHQMERLEQLRVQQLGVQALSDPEIAAKLNITDDQKKKMQEVQEQAMTQMREAFQGGGAGGDRQAAFERMRAMRTETETKLLAVLNDDQKKQFEELQGEKFEFPAPQFGGGRGGPGGRRGGGNNNPNN